MGHRWESASAQRSAYVAQEELFMPTLDAWETLDFQAVPAQPCRPFKSTLA